MSRAYPDASHSMHRDGTHRIVNMNEIEEQNGNNCDESANETDDVRLPRVDHGARSWRGKRGFYVRILSKIGEN